MEFKPTIIKTVFAVVGGVVIGFVTSNLLRRPGSCSEGVCIDFGASNTIFVLVSIISILMGYVIWSLVQEKK